MKHTHTYGWKPDKLDIRDKTFQIKNNIELPAFVDLREVIKLPILDQGSLGSCTANAISSAHLYNQISQDKKETFIPSRLFIYFNEREMEGTIEQDSGAAIRDGIKSINRFGVCDENIWPYDIDSFTERPYPECYEQALLNQSLEYRRVEQSRFQIKAALAEGNPIVFGFQVYPSFESKAVKTTGTATMPNFWERWRGPIGGHAVLCVGYRDLDSVFICQNSWGCEWGSDGFFTLPQQYLTNQKLASDFWVISEIEI